jgi:hypothetical protein
MLGNLIIMGVIGVVTYVIGIVIVDGVVADTTFTSSALLNTIVPYIPVLFALGGMALAGTVVMPSG